MQAHTRNARIRANSRTNIHSHTNTYTHTHALATADAITNKRTQTQNTRAQATSACTLVPMHRTVRHQTHPQWVDTAAAGRCRGHSKAPQDGDQAHHPLPVKIKEMQDL